MQTPLLCLGSSRRALGRNRGERRYRLQHGCNGESAHVVYGVCCMNCVHNEGFWSSTSFGWVLGWLYMVGSPGIPRNSIELQDLLHRTSQQLICHLNSFYDGCFHSVRYIASFLASSIHYLLIDLPCLRRLSKSCNSWTLISYAAISC